MKTKIFSIGKTLTALFSAFILLSGMNVSAISTYSSGVVQIDGYFDEWESIPQTDFYYNPDMRHKVALFRDDEYLYLYVHMTENGGYTNFNGANYRVKADGYEVSFIITHNNYGQNPGVTNAVVRYQNGYDPVPGSTGRLFIASKGAPDVCEMAIPLKAFAYDGIWKPTGIDTSSISSFTFQCPNLGNQTAAATGTDTLPAAGVGLCAAAAIGGVTVFRKKQRGTK